MKKMFSLAALGMAALGTTLWAQQSEEPPTAEAPPALSDAAAREDEAFLKNNEPVPSSTIRKPGASSPNIPNARATSPYRSKGDGSSYSGPAGPAGGLSQPYLQPPSNNGPRAYAGPAQPGVGLPSTYPQNNGLLHSYPESGEVPYYAPNGMQQINKLSKEEFESAQEFRQTVEALRNAKTEEEKADIRAKLNDLVGKQIDQDLADRERRLTELEAKAKQLREQLQQRKQTKAEIQKMLVMLIENPQGGLGLPPAWMNAINQPATFPPGGWQHSYNVQRDAYSTRRD